TEQAAGEAPREARDVGLEVRADRRALGGQLLATLRDQAGGLVAGVREDLVAAALTLLARGIADAGGLLAGLADAGAVLGLHAAGLGAGLLGALEAALDAVVALGVDLLEAGEQHLA